MADNPLSGVGDKLGKLPPMAIVVVVTGALAIAYFVNRGNGSTSNTGTGGVPDESGTGGMTPGIVSGGITNNPAAPGYQDNEAWGSAAVGWLIGYGIGTVEAGTAIRKYLSSDQLTQREKGLIDLVSKQPPSGIGPPPNIPAGGGVNPGDAIPPAINTPETARGIVRPRNTFTANDFVGRPVTPALPTPTTIPGWNGRVYQVKAGNSLSSIAGSATVYGNPKQWPDIYNANKDRISNPNVIQAGTWLRIP